MNTSASQEELDLELRVIQLLTKLAAESPTQFVTASSIAVELNARPGLVLPVLSGLALRGLLRAKVVLACSGCGAEGLDETLARAPVDEFCASCGGTVEHSPIVVYELGDALKKAGQRSAGPKRRRRIREMLERMRRVYERRRDLPH